MVETRADLSAAIPAELRERPQWVLHSADKRPLQANGDAASSTDPATWCSFADAEIALKANADRFAGLGFVFTADDSFVGVDLDDCRNAETGVIESWAQTIINKLDSYAEVSPSGTGVKIWCKGELPGNGSGRKAPYESGAVEAYQHSRYFCVTGQAVGDSRTVRHCQEEITDLWRTVFGAAATADSSATIKPDPSSRATAEEIADLVPKLLALPRAVSGEGGSNATIHAACEIRRVGVYGDAGRKLLDLYNDHCCDPAWSERELDHKWDSARGFVPPAGWEFDALEGESAGGEKPPSRYRSLTSAELAGSDFKIEFLIEGMLVGGQPLIIAGPSKSLKTTSVTDAVISLASGTPFLGRFNVEKAQRVMVMSGESGLPTIKETATRICVARGLKLADLSNLFWSDDLPTFGERAHVVAIGQLLDAYQAQVLVIDPLYLALPGADAANAQIQGQLLRSIGRVCEQRGVCMVLAHHTRKLGRDCHQPLEIGDIAYSAGPQFARQWWLINRRERYKEGSGEHRLWLSSGGSVGQSSIWGVDVVEGVYCPLIPRKWDVSTFPASDTRHSDTARKSTATVVNDGDKVVDAIERLGGKETARTIRMDAKLNSEHFRRAIDQLAQHGKVRQCQILKAGRNYDGWELMPES